MHMSVEPSGSIWVGRKRGTSGTCVGWVRPAPAPEEGWVARTNEFRNGEPAIRVVEETREQALETFAIYWVASHPRGGVL